MSDRRKIATSVRWTPTLLGELKAASAAAGLPMSTCLHLAVRAWVDAQRRPFMLCTCVPPPVDEETP